MPRASNKYYCARKDCVYHPPKGNGLLRETCDYILMEGHKRGCPIVGCTRFATGKRKHDTFQHPKAITKKTPKKKMRSKAEYEAFARNLGVAISKKFPSRAAFARAVGISRNTVSYYCMGKAKPGTKNMEKICELLEINEKELYEVKDETNGM